jgi:hypothetical protein
MHGRSLLDSLSLNGNRRPCVNREQCSLLTQFALVTWRPSMTVCFQRLIFILMTCLPYRSAVDEYTDEILMTIAEVAGTLVPAIGGGESAHTLLPLLESLAEKDETFVRTKVYPATFRSTCPHAIAFDSDQTANAGYIITHVIPRLICRLSCPS